MFRYSITTICFLSLPFQTLSAATLQEAYQSALQKNETVGIQTSQLTQAQERVRQVRGGIMPQISVTGTHLMQPEPDDPIAKQFSPDHQTTVALTAEQALFRGLREFAGLRQQKDLVASKEEQRNQALVGLYQDVTNAYLSVLTNERDLKNIDVQIGIYEDRVKELQGRVRRGESNSTEVLTAQAEQAALKAESQVIRGNLKTARENLAFISGLPVNESVVDPDLAGKKTMESLPYYLKRIEERYDVKSAKKAYDAADEEVGIQKGGHWGTLDLIGNYYLMRPEGFTEDQKWDVQLKLKFPLFEGGSTQSKVREASAKRMEADLTLARARRQAEQEIRSYYESFQSRVNQVEALKISVNLSEKNYQVLQRDYRRGLARNIDVQQALTSFRVASRTYDQARFAAQSELIRLQIASAEIQAPEMKEE